MKIRPLRAKLDSTLWKGWKNAAIIITFGYWPPLPLWMLVPVHCTIVSLTHLFSQINLSHNFSVADQDLFKDTLVVGRWPFMAPVSGSCGWYWWKIFNFFLSKWAKKPQKCWVCFIHIKDVQKKWRHLKIFNWIRVVTRS